MKEIIKYYFDGKVKGAYNMNNRDLRLAVKDCMNGGLS